MGKIVFFMIKICAGVVERKPVFASASDDPYSGRIPGKGER
jgi:hypothetical protein